MIAPLQTAFLTYLEEHPMPEQPAQLYAPIDYILNLGGKRIRPILTLLAAEATGGDYRKALPAARAIEVFHNFSLVHDDIMDEAPLRRGKPTVHKKWDANTGILSGDAMLILAYESLNTYPAPLFSVLTQLFSRTAREVCEGQQYDMNFPLQKEVSQAEYLEMIRLKTAVLLGCALQMGALIGGLDLAKSHAFYDFGIHLGVAFQLQDDYLDAFGDPHTFGKQVGGDIIENKKTMLVLLAQAHGGEQLNQKMAHWMQQHPKDPTEKIAAVKALFVASKANVAIQQLIKEYTQKALADLEGFSIDDSQKDRFRKFATDLMARKI